MNIVVPMKQVPDLQQIRIRDRKPVLDDVPQTYGAIDKNALEAAVQLKEARDADDEVVVVTLGTDEAQDTVKEAMAAGGDRSVLIIDDDAASLDGSAVAAVLAAAIREVEDAQLVIFGEGSADNYSGQVGSRVAQLLGYPQVGYASEITIEGDKAKVVRALEDSLEVVEVALPAVIIAAADLNEPRTPSVMQVLKAGKKPKELKELSDYEAAAASPIETLSNLAPVVERKRIEVKSVQELVDTLKSENLIGR